LRSRSVLRSSMFISSLRLLLISSWLTASICSFSIEPNLVCASSSWDWTSDICFVYTSRRPRLVDSSFAASSFICASYSAIRDRSIFTESLISFPWCWNTVSRSSFYTLFRICKHRHSLP
jgi:hypothetical protein